MEEDQKDTAQDALNTWREYGISTSDGKGKEVPSSNYARASSIQQFCNRFMTSLKERSKQMEKASRREDITGFRNRQVQLAAKRSKYTTSQRSSSRFIISSPSGKNILSSTAPKVVVRGDRGSQRHGSEFGQILDSLKDFQALAMPDLIDKDDIDNDDDSDDDGSSNDDQLDEDWFGSGIITPAESGPPTPRRSNPLTPRKNHDSLSVDTQDGVRTGDGNSTSSQVVMRKRPITLEPISETPVQRSLQNTPKSDGIKKTLTYVCKESDEDFEDLDFFAPKATAQTNSKTGPKRFSFDFLDEKNEINSPACDSVANSRIQDSTTFESLGESFEEPKEGDIDADDFTGGLITGISELRKLKSRQMSGRSLPIKRVNSAGIDIKRSGNTSLSKTTLNGDDNERPGAFTRQTSSLSIALDYLAESMHQVATAAKRRNSASDLSTAIQANNIVNAIEKIFSKVWISARHLALILSYFIIGKEKKTAIFGTYRIEVFVCLFSRVVDPHNLDSALNVLTPYEAACVYCRVGWLNLFNPLKPDGAHVLDLSNGDERVIVKQLALLSAVEPGDNIRASRFRWKWEDDDLSGWVLLAPWVSEDGMPHRGVMYLDYYSGEGIELHGCVANVPFRKSLLALVYASETAIEKDSSLDRTAPIDDPSPRGEEKTVGAHGAPEQNRLRETVGMRHARTHMGKKLPFYCLCGL